MPFGPTSSVQVFTDIIENTLRPHTEYAKAYIDDVCVVAHTPQQMIQRLEAVLTSLAAVGLKVNIKKSLLGTAYCEYLGFLVGPGTLSPLQAKVQAIRELPTPETKKDLRSCLGLANYYRAFQRSTAGGGEPCYAEMAAPLNAQ